MSISSQSEPRGGDTRPESATPSVTTNTPVMYVNINQVLLQTATIVIQDVNNPGRTLSVRAVLDCGSQRSYVSTKVRRELL